ncbi:hypothetical protein, partial [Nostoc sp.]|uniref:hypothetical protein n=1 Tax=Nostoc sp. TaxID=1180 RepID=UPI002FFAAD5E
MKKKTVKLTVVFLLSMFVAVFLSLPFATTVQAQFPWQRADVKMTAVSRTPNSMEVWWIAANGSIQDAYWYEGSQWQRFELAPAGSASIN